MGAYLSEPNLKKESLDDEDGQLSYGASSMQGWRLEQEDSHNAILDFDLMTNTSFFAVYDGHGGAEVAQYCAKYLPDYLKTLDQYKTGNLEEALKTLFLKFDESLLSAEAEKILKDFQEKGDSTKDGEEDEEENGDDTEEEDNEENEKENKEKTDKPTKEYANEADALCDEACMPLEEVLKRYSNTEKKVKKVLKKNATKTTEASSSKDEPPKTASDFNQQEELDIKEIKKNGNAEDEVVNENSTSNHQVTEQEIDEASNLCDLTDSQKSITDLDKTEVKPDIEPEAINISIHKTPKPKLNKEELKLSPIHKKSLSSSSLSEDVITAGTNTTVVNGTSNKEEPKEAENNQENEQNGSKKTSLSRSHLIAKLLAGCIKEKLKQSKTKKQKNKEEPAAEDEEEDEDFVPKEEVDANDDDDDTEESGDEDDDYSEDDDDDEEEDEDDEEDDEEEEEEAYDQQAGNGCRPGYDSGCTAVIAVLHENKHLYVANAGDSRCVVCRDGKAIEMSYDHKPEDDIERERVEKAGGHVTKDGRINNGLNLSRAIGDHSYKANKDLPLSEQMITSLPDIQKLDIDITKDSFMILACDGIWNFMSSQDVCDFIQERLNANYSKLSQICEELFMHCLAPNSEGDGTGCDNMTCILVTFKPFRKIEFKMNKTVDAETEKTSLKRSLENGVIEDLSLANQTVLAKKLKQEEEQKI